MPWESNSRLTSRAFFSYSVRPSISGSWKCPCPLWWLSGSAGESSFSSTFDEPTSLLLSIAEWMDLLDTYKFRTQQWYSKVENRRVCVGHDYIPSRALFSTRVFARRLEKISFGNAPKGIPALKIAWIWIGRPVTFISLSYWCRMLTSSLFNRIDWLTDWLIDWLIVNAFGHGSRICMGTQWIFLLVSFWVAHGNLLGNPPTQLTRTCHALSSSSGASTPLARP